MLLSRRLITATTFICLLLARLPFSSTYFQLFSSVQQNHQPHSYFYERRWYQSIAELPLNNNKLWNVDQSEVHVHRSLPASRGCLRDPNLYVLKQQDSQQHNTKNSTWTSHNLIRGSQLKRADTERTTALCLLTRQHSLHAQDLWLGTPESTSPYCVATPVWRQYSLLQFRPLFVCTCGAMVLLHHFRASIKMDCLKKTALEL